MSHPESEGIGLDGLAGATLPEPKTYEEALAQNARLRAELAALTGTAVAPYPAGAQLVEGGVRAGEFVAWVSTLNVFAATPEEACRQLAGHLAASARELLRIARAEAAARRG